MQEVKIEDKQQEEKEVANKRVVVPEILGLPDRAKSLLGRNLTIRDLDKFPTGADFRDPETREYVDQSIAENKCIVFSSVKMTTAQWSDQNEFGRWRFRFLWHGRGIDGRVMLLVINDAFPSMYIRCPDGMPEANFVRMIKTDVSVLGMSLANEIEIVYKKRFVWAEDNPKPYARLAFVNTQDYYNAIEHFKDIKRLVVANTDFAAKRLYLQMTRESAVNPAGMNCFKFKARGNPNMKQIVSDIDEIFTVSIKDIKPWKPGKEETREAFWIPRMTHINFDIETGSAVRGQALYAERDDTHSHVVSFTMRHNRKDQLRVSLTTSEFAKPKAGYIQFICGSEIEMFILLANLWRRLRPAIISTYNGDNFDWRFIVTKLRKAKFVAQFFSALDFLIVDHTWLGKKGGSAESVEDKILRYYMRDTTIKISAEDSKCPIYYPEVISFLNIDIFTKCKQLWPASKFSEKSLNAFLAKVGEPPKYDMPAWRQFDIYEVKLEVDAEKKASKTGSPSGLPQKYFQPDGNATAMLEEHIEDITNVNVYCVFDTISALDLCDKAGITTSMIIVGEQYMCSLNEAIYLAKGGLVMDVVVYTAFHEGYLDGDEPRDTGRGYPGAYVVHPPIRGITTITPRVSDRMVSDPMWKIITNEEAEAMIAMMRENWKNPMECDKVHKLSESAVVLFRNFWNEYKNVPVVDFDFESMYPTIMAEHNSSPENMVQTPEEEARLLAKGVKLYQKTRTFDGKTVRTALVQAPDEIKADGTRVPASPDKRGIIPSVQYALKIKRKGKQLELGIARKKLAALREANPGGEFPVEEAICDRLNAEQLECKISMNTMYGKLGDPSNKFFRLAISSDVTLTGREYLEEVIRFLESLGWKRIRYGDTDSVYVELPSELFDEFHYLFFTEQITREEYAHRMTEHAIVLGREMSKKINAHLRSQGSDFMNMAFEGAHFPAIFIRQKRNVTRFHGENTKFKANFDHAEDRNKESFHITGIAWKKDKAASKLFVELSSEMIFRLLDINNLRAAADIARDVIREAYAKAEAFKYPMDYFIQRATYKPEKHNIRVINFLERLRREGRNPPQAYQKFEYVKIRRDDIEFNDAGCKADTSAADYMELFSYAMEKKLPVDFSEYMLGEICNEIANYMCCDPRYIVLAPYGDTSAAALVAAEDATLKLGNKYIGDLCNEMAGTLTTAVKKPVYTAVKSQATNYLRNIVPSVVALTKTSDLRLLDNARKASGALNMYLKKIETGAAEDAIPIAEKLKSVYCNQGTEPIASGVIVDMCTKMSSRTDSPKVLYCNQVHEKKEALLMELKAECKKIDDFAAWHSDHIAKITSKIRTQIGLAKPIISGGDITSAIDALKSGVIDKIDVPISDLAKIPNADIFDKCTRLVNDLIAIEKQSIAFDIFRDHLNCIIRSRTGGGLLLNDTHVKSTIHESRTGIQTDDSAFEMPVSRGD
jgi:DNA polymerase elongation subunit (family B)